MNKLQIGLVVGSLRKASINRQLACAVIKLAPADVSFKFIEIGDLPLYNQDDDDHQSDSVKRMKQEVAACDGVLFITPEYNRSVPGVLKNALDHGSRPPGQNSWGGKPAAIMGLSPSPVGTALAQQHLRLVLATLDMPTLGQPEMFLQMKEGFFDADGSISAGGQKFFRGWMDRLIAWMSAHQKG